MESCFTCYLLPVPAVPSRHMRLPDSISVVIHTAMYLAQSTNTPWECDITEYIRILIDSAMASALTLVNMPVELMRS